MDDLRFDAVSRALARASSRRAALAALAALVPGGPAHDSRAKRKRRRRKCDPPCPPGQTCAKGACACDDGGTVCGAECCLPGQQCREGACAPPPPACIPAGAPCKGLGRVCCDGRACASGQGGKRDIACYVPAGGACETTAECVFDSACVDGACVATPRPTPQPLRPCAFQPTGDPAADGDRLLALVADPAGPDPILLCPGVYRASATIAILRDLRIEAANPGTGEVIVDGGWTGGNTGDGRLVFQVGNDDPVAPVQVSVDLAGIAVRNGFGGGIFNFLGSRLALTDVTVSKCYSTTVGGGIQNNGTLDLLRVTISGCIAPNGGGLYNEGSATLVETLITGCSAKSQAVGAKNGSAQLQGGGIWNIGTLALGRGTVVSGNSAITSGAGIFEVADGPVTCSGTPAPRICGNPAGGPSYANCAGAALGAGCEGVCAIGAC